MFKNAILLLSFSVMLSSACSFQKQASGHSKTDASKEVVFQKDTLDLDLFPILKVEDLATPRPDEDGHFTSDGYRIFVDQTAENYLTRLALRYPQISSRANDLYFNALHLPLQSIYQTSTPSLRV